MRALVIIGTFIGLPLLEIYVIIQVGQAIGALPTILLLILESVIGAWVVKREGARAWRALNAAVGSGVLPARELGDAAIILIGGVLLLTPGFVTDIFGFFCVLPFTRPIARRLLAMVVSHRIMRYDDRRFSARRGDVHQIYTDEPPGP